MHEIMTETDANTILQAPYRPLRALAPAVDVQTREDGSILMHCPYPLKPVEQNVLRYLHHWAETDGDRTLFAERDGQREWRRITFAEMRALADGIAQALLDLGMQSGDRLMILSENSIEHAAMALGAMTVGVVVVPVAPAYALMSQDFAKLRHVIDLVEPDMIFAQDGGRFSRAIEAVAAPETRIVITGEPLDGRDSLQYADLAATVATPAVEAAFARIGPDTVAKILFTSGSTGFPKGVINTQYMMCANQSMSDSLWELTYDEPPVLLSWLPWNHTMGGNALFNRALRIGGALYIDDGRPTPQLFSRTIENLRDISPSSFANVPAAFAMLADALEADDTLRERFFRRLETLSYAGASLPKHLWDRMQALAVRTIGMRIPFTSGYGATETAPMICSLYWVTEEHGVIGLPPPGVDIKLAPVPGPGQRYEIRARGRTVTPGYYRQPDVTAAAFDEEGFYRMGDAVAFVDPQDALQGLRFAGRVKEDFKLTTGTWVATTALRLKVLDATAPLLRDAVITGDDQPHLGLLAWLSREEADDAGIHERLTSALRAYNAANPGSSTRIVRYMLLQEPPNADAGEITDKGYINRAAVLHRRAAQVAALYARQPSNNVVEL